MQRLKIEPQADLNSNRNMCTYLLALHYDGTLFILAL